MSLPAMTQRALLLLLLLPPPPLLLLLCFVDRDHPFTSNIYILGPGRSFDFQITTTRCIITGLN
jgi:hypothetical protein